MPTLAQLVTVKDKAWSHISLVSVFLFHFSMSLPVYATVYMADRQPNRKFNSNGTASITESLYRISISETLSSIKVIEKAQMGNSRLAAHLKIQV